MARHIFLVATLATSPLCVMSSSLGMSAIEKLSEEEAYLWAILSDQTGVDQAEFLWVDEDKPDRCFRLWDFQWPFLQNTEKYQVDLLARGLGKALALDTPIPTPDGWKDMGGLQVGDTVFDENGAPTKVTQAWDVRYDRPCYEVEFSDGSVIVADGEHQWLTWDKDARTTADGTPKVRTTEEIKTSLYTGSGLANHSIAAPSGRVYILAVQPVESVPVRCIEVDSPSHLFLAGKGMIPTHNSVSITMAALAFPFDNPAQDFLITAPQMKHLKLITDTIMQVKTYSRIYDEMLPKGRQGGVVHAPSFQMNFVNHAHIITRLPGVDGKGLKGPHPIRIEMDECFPAGTLILTDRGQVPIEAVEVGDRVLTHEGRWRAVERTWDRGVQPAVRLKGQGHPGLISTADHLYWGSSDGASGEWVPAQEMVGKKWATPAQARGLTPPMGIIPRTPTGASVDIDPSTNDFAWALGLYLAEGSLSSSYGKGGRTNRIYWSVNDQVTGEVIQRLTRLGVTPRAMPTNGACDNVLVTHQHYAQWLEKHVGRGARIKQVPAWVYSMPEEYRRQVLMGAIYGDGWLDNNPGFTGKRWKVATAGKPMAISLRILASSLDYDTCLYWNPPPVQKSSISGREINSGGWYQLVIAEVGRGVRDSNHIWSAVKSVEPAEPARMYDLQVADDNSFVADGVVVHNSQDITEAAYMEIIETIKINAENARWRVHGVSNGTRDMHYKLTHGQGTGLPFYVHKYMAMHRPDWNDEERENKISIYGGTEDHPDYVRNVYGEPSDLGNPIFVTARLMAIASIAQTPADEEYNTQLYTRMNISQELIDSHGDFLPLMDWNYAHLDEKYTSFWGGMDVGFTNDPSEILIFGSEKGFDRLLLRIHLERVTAPYQEQIIREVFKFYGARLKRFGMDKTGNGLPLWHYLKDHKGVADRIAGYNFGSKVAAELEDRELAWDEKVEDLAIMKWAKDHATDLLRKAVDTKTIRLPFDNDLLTEWQGQSVTTVRVATSQDGTIRQYSGGECHSLDAGRMYILAKGLMGIEAMLEKPKHSEPVLDMFY